MPNYFSEQQISELLAGYHTLHAKYAELLFAFVGRAYATEKAKEYGTHGLSRRLCNLLRCIDRVFEVLPPDRDTVPSREEVLDATINVQAFMFNVFGSLENLAWIWVFERGVNKENGAPLDRRQVGLGERYKRVRASFSPEFNASLESYRGWFEHITDFRDALAHRIPLYIPPLTIHPENAERYVALHEETQAALMQRDREQYRQSLEERGLLEQFQPIMVHSLNEGSRPIVFHPQLIADFNTVDELARELLAELDRSGI